VPEDPPIAPGRPVLLHLEVRFENGFVALSTFDDEPIACTIGDGTLTPGLESAIAGLTTGADTRILASGADLFGPRDDANIHWLDRRDFPAGLEPEPGRVIAFETPAGHETSGVVLELDGQRVRVDFNHPFAGHALALRVRVLSVG